MRTDPERPDPPSNVTEGDTVIEDGKVAVTIHWSPPVNSDLPLSRYKASDKYGKTLNSTGGRTSR